MIDTSNVPPKGWRYTVEETGVEISASSHLTLVGLVRKHMRANGVREPANLYETVSDTACRNLGEWCDRWCSNAKKPTETKRSRWALSSVKSFVLTMKDWYTKHGMEFVAPAEAERRAEICVKCPFNIPVDGCVGCAGVLSLVNSVRGGASTSKDADLDVCDMCGCELKLKVWVPQDAIAGVEGIEFPEGCWQRSANREATTEEPVTDQSP